MQRDFNIILNELEMQNAAGFDQFLLLEGVSDVKFFKRFLEETVKVVECQGRRNLEKVIVSLNTEGQNSYKYAGIVDEDYDWCCRLNPIPNQIIKFDPRDLEGMLIRSSAFESVLIEYGDENKIRAIESSYNNKKIKDIVLEKSEIFGKVRVFNALNNKIDLSEVKPVRWCDDYWNYDRIGFLSDMVNIGVCESIEKLEDNLNKINYPSIWHLAFGKRS